MGPKLEWVYRHEPEVFERATGFYGSTSYITAKLTGEYTQDHNTASHSGPLYATREFDWNREWAGGICRHLALPRLVWPGEVVGTVQPDAAAATRVPAGTPVVAGTLDAYSEAFSVGVRHPGDRMLMYGSTMFLVQIIDTYQTDPTLWTTTGVERRTLALAAGTSTAGSLMSWLQTVTGAARIETLLAEAQAVPPGAEGLLVLPYFAGERTPVFDPHARGVFVGLTLRHGRGHLIRAAYEGIAFGIRQILERFDDAQPASRTVAVGGGLRSPIWAQTVSDVTGRTQLVPEQAIGASYGDALLAAIGVGLVPQATDWAKIARVIEPIPATTNATTTCTPPGASCIRRRKTSFIAWRRATRRRCSPSRSRRPPGCFPIRRRLPDPQSAHSLPRLACLQREHGGRPRGADHLGGSDGSPRT